jgi:hypothetical protein
VRRSVDQRAPDEQASTAEETAAGCRPQQHLHAKDRTAIAASKHHSAEYLSRHPAGARHLHVNARWSGVVVLPVRRYSSLVSPLAAWNEAIPDANGSDRIRDGESRRNAAGSAPSPAQTAGENKKGGAALSPAQVEWKQRTAQVVARAEERKNRQKIKSQQEYHLIVLQTAVQMYPNDIDLVLSLFKLIPNSKRTPKHVVILAQAFLNTDQPLLAYQLFQQSRRNLAFTERLEFRLEFAAMVRTLQLKAVPEQEIIQHAEKIWPTLLANPVNRLHPRTVQSMLEIRMAAHPNEPARWVEIAEQTRHLSVTNDQVPAFDAPNVALLLSHCAESLGRQPADADRATADARWMEFIQRDLLPRTVGWKSSNLNVALLKWKEAVRQHQHAATAPRPMSPSVLVDQLMALESKHADLLQRRPDGRLAIDTAGRGTPAYVEYLKRVETVLDSFLVASSPAAPQASSGLVRSLSSEQWQTLFRAISTSQLLHFTQPYWTLFRQSVGAAETAGTWLRWGWLRPPSGEQAAGTREVGDELCGLLIECIVRAKLNVEEAIAWMQSQQPVDFQLGEEFYLFLLKSTMRAHKNDIALLQRRFDLIPPSQRTSKHIVVLAEAYLQANQPLSAYSLFRSARQAGLTFSEGFLSRVEFTAVARVTKLQLAPEKELEEYAEMIWRDVVQHPQALNAMIVRWMLHLRMRVHPDDPGRWAEIFHQSPAIASVMDEEAAVTSKRLNNAATAPETGAEVKQQQHLLMGRMDQLSPVLRSIENRLDRMGEELTEIGVHHKHRSNALFIGVGTEHFERYQASTDGILTELYAEISLVDALNINGLTPAQAVHIFRCIRRAQLSDRHAARFWSLTKRQVSLGRDTAELYQTDPAEELSGACIPDRHCAIILECLALSREIGPDGAWAEQEWMKSQAPGQFEVAKKSHGVILAVAADAVRGPKSKALAKAERLFHRITGQFTEDAVSYRMLAGAYIRAEQPEKAYRLLHASCAAFPPDAYSLSLELEAIVHMLIQRSDRRDQLIARAQEIWTLTLADESILRQSAVTRWIVVVLAYAFPREPARWIHVFGSARRQAGGFSTRAAQMMINGLAHFIHGFPVERRAVEGEKYRPLVDGLVEHSQSPLAVISLPDGVDDAGHHEEKMMELRERVRTAADEFDQVVQGGQPTSPPLQLYGQIKYDGGRWELKGKATTATTT